MWLELHKGHEWSKVAIALHDKERRVVDIWLVEDSEGVGLVLVGGF